MPAITIADLSNAKLDVDHIAEIATSLNETTTDRHGNEKKTMAGAIAAIAAITNRGTWVTATVYAVKDVVFSSGTWYVCVSAHTSGATFAGDSATRWRVYQGVIAEDLASISDASKGAAMVGYAGALLSAHLKTSIGKVVASIAGLKAVDKTKYTTSFVTGYYGQGDGGGGPYWYDASDTTSSDNGGTIIVAADGGRWKLSATTEISLKQFGAKGDNATNDAAAIQAAVSCALASGKHLHIPAGTYLCNAQITGSGCDVSMSGDGVSVSRIVFTAATGGFAFALDAQGVNTPPDQINMSDLTIESRAAVSSPAISATWSAYQPNAQGSCWIENIQITRKDDGTGSFAAGIRLTKCVVGFIRSCALLGDELRVSATGIDLIDCIGIRINACDVNRYQTGAKASVVSATQTEGLYLSDCFLYDLNKGLDVSAAIHVEVLGTHININGASAVYDISFTNVSQSFIAQCLLYAGGSVGSAASEDGIRLVACSGVTINNNVFTGVTKANTRYGVAVSGLSTYNQIIGNNFTAFATGVTFAAAGDTNNNMVANQFFSCTANVGDAGTANYKAQNTGDGAALNGLQWGTAFGSFGVGELSANSSWGGYFRGRSGTSGDLAFADSAGAACATVRDGSFKVRSVAKASLPLATSIGGSGIIYVSDEIGGGTIAFSDGTNWRRVADRAIVA